MWIVSEIYDDDEVGLNPRYVYGFESEELARMFAMSYDASHIGVPIDVPEDRLESGYVDVGSNRWGEQGLRVYSRRRNTV